MYMDTRLILTTDIVGDDGDRRAASGQRVYVVTRRPAPAPGPGSVSTMAPPGLWRGVRRSLVVMNTQLSHDLGPSVATRSTTGSRRGWVYLRLMEPETAIAKLGGSDGKAVSG